jgi:hypothetical protein
MNRPWDPAASLQRKSRAQNRRLSPAQSLHRLNRAPNLLRSHPVNLPPKNPAQSLLPNLPQIIQVQNPPAIRVMIHRRIQVASHLLQNPAARLPHTHLKDLVCPEAVVAIAMILHKPERQIVKRVQTLKSR